LTIPLLVPKREKIITKDFVARLYARIMVGIRASKILAFRIIQNQSDIHQSRCFTPRNRVSAFYFKMKRDGRCPLSKSMPILKKIIKGSSVAPISFSKDLNLPVPINSTNWINLSLKLTYEYDPTLLSNCISLTFVCKEKSYTAQCSIFLSQRPLTKPSTTFEKQFLEEVALIIANDLKIQYSQECRIEHIVLHLFVNRFILKNGFNGWALYSRNETNEVLLKLEDALRNKVREVVIEGKTQIQDLDDKSIAWLQEIERRGTKVFLPKKTSIINRSNIYPSMDSLATPRGRYSIIVR